MARKFQMLAVFVQFQEYVPAAKGLAVEIAQPEGGVTRKLKFAGDCPLLMLATTL